ncbi:hypothetical protein GQ53DRAFT_300502 [Thozetella sp. PMI_491]|nr:hypothetical protein GQ53DRAFT_300502 [Thozetella sp. PMI_491]
MLDVACLVPRSKDILSGVLVAPGGGSRSSNSRTTSYRRLAQGNPPFPASFTLRANPAGQCQAMTNRLLPRGPWLTGAGQGGLPGEGGQGKIAPGSRAGAGLAGPEELYRSQSNHDKVAVRTLNDRPGDLYQIGAVFLAPFPRPPLQIRRPTGFNTPSPLPFSLRPPRGAYRP